MKKLKTILLALGILVLVGMVSGAAYYIYDGIYFFNTENAQVTSTIVTITPEITGKLQEWHVKEGDLVKTGQILGKQDLSTMITSSAVNPQGLGNSADLMIAKADIKSPIDGQVVQSNVVKGEVISPGMEIATIADTAHVYIKANIEETDIFRIQLRQLVDIKIDAYADHSFQGYVESVGQVTTSALSQSISLNTSGTYSKVTQLIPVRIAIMNQEQLTLMPGMNASIKIHIK